MDQQYKNLNAELVTQLQLQKLEIAEYRKKIISLQAELMEEQDRRALEKTRAEHNTKCAIQSLISSLGLSESLQLMSIASESRRCSSIRQMTDQMRRSSALSHNTLTVSPRRRSPSVIEDTQSEEEAAEQSIRVTPAPRRVEEIQNESPESESTVEPTPTPARDLLLSILEENDEVDEKEVSLLSDSADESVLTTYNLCTPTPVVTPKRQPGKQWTEPVPFRDVTNDTPSQKVTLTRGGSHKTAGEAATPKVDENISIQQVRRNENRSMLEPTAALGTTALHTSLELSYAIANAPGSTPRALRKSTGPKADQRTAEDRENPLPPGRKKQKGRPSRTSRSASSDNESTGRRDGRPSRSCRPKSLKEPDCHMKLRNESNEKSLGKK